MDEFRRAIETARIRPDMVESVKDSGSTVTVRYRSYLGVGDGYTVIEVRVPKE